MLSLPSLGDVAHGGRDEDVATCVERRQGDVDREFGAVLASCGKLEAGTHCANAWISEVRSPMFGMRVAKPIRNEHLDVLADELLRGVAEQRMHLSVDEHYRSAPVDDHDGVRRGVEQPTEHRRGSLALADVADECGRDRTAARLDRGQ